MTDEARRSTLVRMKPQEPLNQTYGARFDAMCRATENFWQLNTMPRTSGPLIVVDMLSQDIRVAIRILTLAASIQRHMNARIVALVGPDSYWKDMIWSYYDLEVMTQIAESYGAAEVLDLQELLTASRAGVTEFRVLDDTVTIPEQPGTDPQRYQEIAEATQMRALRIPLVTDEVRASEEYLEIEDRNFHYARIMDGLFAHGVEALITSHIDYHQWGYAVDAAVRHGVTVHHVQSTGSFKSYALFPETVRHDLTPRQNWTLQIAEYFDAYIWPARHVLRRAAETVAFRAKSNYGRPSWWRGGGSISELGFKTPAERASVREHAMRTLGFDASKPVVTVYNHAVSDAVHSNYEIFDNLADWLIRTVEFAAQHPESNWLILDHPAQPNYDGTMMFEDLAEKYAHLDHMVFRQSMDLSKNVLWSLVDLAVTVRGSVSNEFPAYGVPAIQAGWSEWSHLGFSFRADDQDEYWNLILDSIQRIRDGEQLVSSTMRERARLWLWFYRSATDVSSGFVPHWESSQGDRLYLAVTLACMHVESDGDAGLAAVRRMLKRRDPFLTRIDFAMPTDELADALAIVGPLDSTMPDSAPVETEDDHV